MCKSKKQDHHLSVVTQAPSKVKGILRGKKNKTSSSSCRCFIVFVEKVLSMLSEATNVLKYEIVTKVRALKSLQLQNEKKKTSVFSLI